MSPTGHGEWQHYVHETALETTEYLVLYGKVENPEMQWTLLRECRTAVTVLQAMVSEQGEAVEISRAFYRGPTVGSNTGKVYRCWTGIGLCAGWQYHTRFRVDSDDIRERRWMYGWDAESGVEQLYMIEAWHNSSRFEGVRPGHSADLMLVGDRLALEIGPVKGVAVFNTAGFEEALTDFCDGDVAHPYPARWIAN